MKFDCGDPDERERYLSNWHPWLAWRPVRVAGHDCRWLEYVERKGTHYSQGGDCWWTWEYRLPLLK